MNYHEELEKEKEIGIENYPDILSVELAAEFLNISKAMLYRLAKQNKVPHANLGRRILFRKSDLLDWIGSMVVTPCDDCNF